MPQRPSLVGILNLSPESFSDGAIAGRSAQADAERGAAMLEGGADFVELGAASSHPDAREIEPSEEIDRLGPVLEALRDSVDRIGVDTWKPSVQAFAASAGVAFVNDIQGFADEGALAELASSGCDLVAMHSVQGRGKATRGARLEGDPVATVSAFFDALVARLETAGIARKRLIVDPGMGFFLGDAPEPSLQLLARLPEIKARVGLPVLISVSRKSFLGAVTGAVVEDRGAATLAAELAAAARGADYIRTHDPTALDHALLVQAAIDGETP